MTFKVFRVLENLDMAMNLLHYRKMCILFLIIKGNLDMNNHKKKKMTNLQSYHTDYGCYDFCAFTSSNYTGLFKKHIHTISYVQMFYFF